MASIIKLTCGWCGKEFERSKSEYDAAQRLKPGANSYCCIACSAKGIHRDKKTTNRVYIERKCIVCGKLFKTSYLEGYTGNNEWVKNGTMYCSRGCASKGSVTEYRRNKARETADNNFHRSQEDLIQDARNLNYQRDKWKYSDIETYLNEKGIKFEFEYILENKIFDLCIPELNLLIEFDGPDHKYDIENDILKNAIARSNGYTLHRIDCKPNQIINASVISNLITI